VNRKQPAAAPGVVGVRLSGEMADIVAATELLARAGAEVLDMTGPRPNRYDPGVRVHLTVRLPAAEPRTDPGREPSCSL
jgi:hypothetical protein